MKINTDNPIIKFSGKGKPFQYDKLLYATLNEYILDYKNARLDKLTDQDASICLARIIRKWKSMTFLSSSFSMKSLKSGASIPTMRRYSDFASLWQRISSAV